MVGLYHSYTSTPSDWFGFSGCPILRVFRRVGVLTSLLFHDQNHVLTRAGGVQVGLARAVVDMAVKNSGTHFAALGVGANDGAGCSSCAGEGTIAFSLFVDIPAVGDAGDAHHLAVVIDDVHDAVIPDADAPEILLTAQFPAAGWSWIGGRVPDPSPGARSFAVFEGSGFWLFFCIRESKSGSIGSDRVIRPGGNIGCDE